MTGMRGRARVDLARFVEILNAYGAEPRRWPAAECAAALALAETSPHAAALREEAARLDRLMDRVGVHSVSPGLAAAVLMDAEPARHAPLRRLIDLVRTLSRDVRPYGGVWRPALALLLATGLGLGAGMGGVVQTGPAVTVLDNALGAYGELVE